MLIRARQQNISCVCVCVHFVSRTHLQISIPTSLQPYSRVLLCKSHVHQVLQQHGVCSMLTARRARAEHQPVCHADLLASIRAHL